LPDISLLEYTAFASVFIIFCFVVIVTVLAGRFLDFNLVNWSNVKSWDFTLQSIFEATPTVSLAYTCQTSVFPIWKELQNPSKARMNRVQLTGSLIACVFYVVAGILGYIYSPVKTPGNFLSALPDSLFYVIFRLFFAIAIVFHYPVVHYAFRNSITTTLFPGKPFFWPRHVIITVLTMVVTTVISLVIPDLGKVFALTGALAAYPIDFLLPALAYSKICLYDGAKYRGKKYSTILDAEESISEVLASPAPSVNDNGDRKKTSKLAGLITNPRFLAPFLMIVGSVASSIISLYVIIHGTDWSHLFSKPKQ